MATMEELRAACKDGLNIQADETAFNDVLDQKINLIKGYMMGAGVNSAVMDGEQAISALVLGVGDSWDLSPGELKFSRLFHTLLTQLVAESSLLTYVADPADGSTGVAVDTAPRLTFSDRISSYAAELMTYSDQVSVVFSSTLDVTERVIMITPAALRSATKYALVFTAVSEGGPSLKRTVISFTTA